MPNLTVIGQIIQKRADGLHDDTITSFLSGNGTSENDIQAAFKALEDDIVLIVHTKKVLRPVNPIVYRFGIHRIEKETMKLWGLFKETIEVGVRTIDSLNISRSLVKCKANIMHSGSSEMLIDDISRADADRIRVFYAEVIEAQRKNVVTIAQD